MQASILIKRHSKATILSFFTVLGIIALCEVVVMMILPYVAPNLEGIAEACVVSLLLALIAGPFLWQLLVHPLLRASERQERLLENSDEGLITLDAHGVVRSWNLRASELLGIDDAAPLGRSLCEVESAFRPALEELRESGASEVTLNRRGATLRVSLSASDLLSTSVVIRDISDEVRAIAMLEEANRHLETSAANASRTAEDKSRFLSTMSHELRTPLNAIIGYTSLTLETLEERLPEEELGDLRQAKRSADLLLRLINDVLDFSKLEAGMLEISLEDVELGELFEECRLAIGSQMRESGLRYEEQLPPTAPTVRADFERLAQVLRNLLGNAFKATDEGSITLRALVLEEGARVRIEVQDTGCGIPEEDQEAIFGAFKQVGPVNTRNLCGTGLGLAIAKQLSELMGAELRVQSEPGSGTTFSVELDATPASLVGAATGSRARSESEEDTLERLSADLVLSRELPHSSLHPVVVFCGGEQGFEHVASAIEGFPLRALYAQTQQEVSDLMNTQSIWAVVLEPTQLADEFLRWLEDQAVRMPLVLTFQEGAGLLPQRIHHISKPFDPGHITTALSESRATHGRVMVVDDDPASRELVSRALESLGFVVSGLGGGAEAIEALRKGPLPQAVFLDLLMPKVDGFDVLRALQDVDGWRRVAVIIVTAKDLSQQERSWLEEYSNGIVQRSSQPRRTSQDLRLSLERVRSRSVLVVDDNYVNRRLAKTILEAADYNVMTAASGAEAIEACRGRLFDTVLMDLGMPGLDGYETTEALRALPGDPPVVIACTAYSGEAVRQAAHAAGCAGFISKPIEPRTLVHCIQYVNLFEKARRQAELAEAS